VLGVGDEGGRRVGDEGVGGSGTRALVPATRAGDEGVGDEGGLGTALRTMPEKKTALGTMVGGGGGVAPWARGAPGDELSAVAAGDEGVR